MSMGTMMWGGDKLVEQVKEIKAKEKEKKDEMFSTMEDIYNQQREDTEPWREAGENALEQMQGGDMSAMLEQDPGYQFRMQQGLDASNASAAARGGSLGGAQMKALQRYGQDYASQEYGNSFNRLSTLAGLGSAGMQTGVGAAGQYSQDRVGLQTGFMNMDNARRMANSNNMSNMIGQGIQMAGLFASDERLKKDIKPMDKSDLKELRETLKPYAYKYKNKELGDGEFFGVMAQDLEKSKLGKTVIEEKDGYKFVNIKKATSLFLAVIAEG